MQNGILILDFGSQYNQLIARRIREFGVYSEVLSYKTTLDQIKQKKPHGIILSGGPSSVNAKDAAKVSKDLYSLGVPILGICYGMQVTHHLLGGKVEKGSKGEYGKSDFKIQNTSPLFKDIKPESTVWMSHFDQLTELADGFEYIGQTDNCIAATQNIEKNIYTVQFHPEVSHTEEGTQMFKNFVFDICRCNPNWEMESFIEKTIKQIKETVGNHKVILGLSGGVDSSVAAVLIHKAIGKNLTCIFVDTGLLRKNERDLVLEQYGKGFDLNIIAVNAEDDFLIPLENVEDPEQKRKVIGKKFIEVFDRESHKIEGVKFLAQGTIYSDVIESSAQKDGASVTIKSHHNVGGLPDEMKLTLLEPLKDLFKDEVRKVGLELGIPKEMIFRHPFPGPGLGIRILGSITKEKVKILQEADAILIEELFKENLYHSVNQAFMVLLPIKSVGVMGDERTYEYTAILRSANSLDFMTATWSRLPYDFLEKVSNRIINEVKGINRVAYDISNKPPATIEWE